MKIFFLFIFSFSLFAQEKLTVDLSNPIHQIKPHFLSFGLDTAQIVGSYWWDKSSLMKKGRGGKKVKPLNLKNKKLIMYAKALSPAYLRIGGSEADALYYQVTKNIKTKPKSFDSVLDQNKWKEIENFVNQTETKLFFTLNQGPSTWDKDNNWQTENLEQFIKYLSQEAKIPISFELGNEIFAYWAIFDFSKRMSEDKYVKNYRTAKKILTKYFPQNELAGPASAFWPTIGEPLGFLFGNISGLMQKMKNQLDIMTWHYYPTQSFRCPIAIERMDKSDLLDPDILDEVKTWADHVLELKSKYSPQTQLWLGETGSAQCGGEPKVSSEFISSFWWLDQLGVLAQKQHEVVIRHNLVGADYALLNDDFTPRPDFYASWMWKHFMGKKVFNIHSTNSSLRAYMHCHPNQKQLSLLVLNLENKVISFTHPFKTEAKIFEVKTNDLHGQQVLVNNGKIMGLKELENLPAKKLTDTEIKLAPYSYSFIVFENYHELCKD